MSKSLYRHKNLTVFSVIYFMACVGMGQANEVGQLTDGRIEGAIERRLAMDARINSETVGVTVNQGHVTLFGSVDSLREYGEANHIAGSVKGVNSVNNTIQINPDLSSDQTIENAISRQLKELGVSENNNVNVQVRDRVVTLEGTVLRQVSGRQAVLVAQSVKGVRKVENLLSVVGHHRSDEAIHKDVILYLLWSPFVDFDDFNITVKKGVVSLQGIVDHPVHKNVLAMDIENIHGVKEVRVGKIVPERVVSSMESDNAS